MTAAVLQFLIIATRNAHKVREIGAILGPSVQCVPMTRFPGTPELIEDGATFQENARAKAQQLARWLGEDPGRLRSLSAGDSPTRSRRREEADLPRETDLPDRLLTSAATLTNCYVLADDSGLEVDALDGAPGVLSARFAAGVTGQSGNSPDADNNAKLLRLLRDVPIEKRTARFRCVLALRRIHAPGDERTTECFEGTCAGRIAVDPAGIGGFGYDPLFIPDGGLKSFAELDEAAKNAISHRSKALAHLRKRLFDEGVKTRTGER